MRFLVISDRIKYGGAEVYARNLVKLLEEHGQEVLMLYFYEAAALNPANDENHYRLVRTCGAEQKLGKLFTLPRVKHEIWKEMKTFTPDYVILNSLNTFFYSTVAAINNCRIINVVHDYRMICHTGRCADGQDRLCEGYRSGLCYQKCHEGFSNIHIWMKLHRVKRVEQIYQSRIAMNIVPSQALTKKCICYGYRAVCIPNPIEQPVVREVLPRAKKKEIVYVGRINRDKGILSFGKQFAAYCEKTNPNAKLLIYGGVEKDVEDAFLKICEHSQIEYRGELEHNGVTEVMRRAYAVVVPSLWVENYPTVVLEAMAAGTPVLASDRGGMVEMLNDERGILYDPLSTQSVHQALASLFSLSDEQYETMVKKSLNYVKENNTFEAYWKRFSEVLKYEI